MSCSRKFYIAVNQFQDFETSICVILKQALIRKLILYMSSFYREKIYIYIE
jgi:hypothetical protein